MLRGKKTRDTRKAVWWLGRAVIFAAVLGRNQAGLTEMPVPIGPQLQVSELIARAVRQGCIVRFAKFRLVAPNGSIIPIRYLYNSANKGRFDLTDYDNEDFVVTSEIENAERRLGIKLV